MQYSLNDVYSVLSKIEDLTTSTEYTEIVNEFQSLISRYHTNQNGINNIFRKRFQSIKKIFEEKLKIFWNDEQIQIIKLYNLDFALENVWKDELDSAIQFLAKNMGRDNGDYIKQIVSKTESLDRVTSLYNAFKPLFEDVEDATIADGEAVIEIVFENDTEIEDIESAKKQINDWFIILSGYAQSLNVSKSDFEIISIVKSSPTRIRIKSTVKNTMLVLSITSSLLAIDKVMLERKLMMEKIRTVSYVTDKQLQDRFIEEAEKSLKESIDKEIDGIVDRKLKDLKLETKKKNELKSTLETSVNKQYQFIVNGGNVNFYINNAEGQEIVNQIERIKNETNQIRTSEMETQKLLKNTDQIRKDDSKNNTQINEDIDDKRDLKD